MAQPKGSEPPRPAPRRGPFLPTIRDAADAGWSLLTTALALGGAIALVEAASTDGPLPVLLAAAAVGLGDFLLRPVLRLVALAAGAIGAMVAGLVAQLLLAWAVLAAVPGLRIDGPRPTVNVILLAALFMALGRWLLGVNDSAYVLGDTMRRARHHARHRARQRARRYGSEPAAEAGLLMVQFDGLSHATLRQAMDSGLTPTLSRWVSEGTHRVEPWWVGVPSTTPAAQAGLLHGSLQEVPAFRWWDRSLGRLVVSNRPSDAAIIEGRISDGSGLLAFGGAAISTMFSGDAPTSLLVMSTAGRGRGLGPGPSFLRFFASPFVLARALTRSVAEIVKELYQGRRQRVRQVEPRVPRRGWYVVLRSITNVLLRDLNVTLIAEHLMRGTPAIYVNLVDYDEIAHHAGPARPEALRALEGLDGILALVEDLVAGSPRHYRIVVLSDHGQSLGPTFKQVEGQDLAEVCRALLAVPEAVSVEAGGDEAWGAVNTLLTSVFRRDPAKPPVEVGPDRPRSEDPAQPELAVSASGNLALIWLPRYAARLTLEELLELFPRLVPGLVERRGVGVVVAHSHERGPVAIGAAGLRVLRDGTVEGDDPLAGYGTQAGPDLLRAAGLANTGDLMVVSTVADNGQVNAFEELVGSHGGLGGPQNLAVLVHPVELAIDDDLTAAVDGHRMVVGAERLHVQLVRWLARLGLRP